MPEYCTLKTDTSKCTSCISGGQAFDIYGIFYDTWYYSDLTFESGKIYGLISEFRQGNMYLSYLLGGKCDIGDGLCIYMNGKKTDSRALGRMSWNLEPSHEYYKDYPVRKAVEKALKKNRCAESSFAEIARGFMLTPERSGCELSALSGERWRASAALGHALGKRIFYAPYETSSFYRQMSQGCLLKALRRLTDSGALVLLPCGARDSFMKHIADECVYLDPDSSGAIPELKKHYEEAFGHGDWIK